MDRGIDGNRFKKTYPLTRGRFQSLATVDNKILTYTNSEAEQTYTFASSYATVPNVIATAVGANVNVFITSITTSSVTVKPSATFTGSIHLQVVEAG